MVWEQNAEFFILKIKVHVVIATIKGYMIDEMWLLCVLGEGYIIPMKNYFMLSLKEYHSIKFPFSIKFLFSIRFLFRISIFTR
jgi:hypothetical protein